MSDEHNHEEEGEGGVATLIKPKVQEPKMYHVFLLNDDYSTMEFVVQVLQRFFQKPIDEAKRIMMEVHHNGQGSCGMYPFDIAETKVMQVNEYARQEEMPLKCVMEKE